MAAELNFQSVLNARNKGVDLFHFDKIDKDYDYVLNNEAIIDWKAIIVKRNSGIESIYAIIHKVEFNMVYTTEEGEEKEYTIKIEDDENGWGIEDEKDNEKDTDTSFYPHNIQINFADKQVFINF